LSAFFDEDSQEFGFGDLQNFNELAEDVRGRVTGPSFPVRDELGLVTQVFPEIALREPCGQSLLSQVFVQSASLRFHNDVLSRCHILSIM
jgi:hypothetical protein